MAYTKTVWKDRQVQKPLTFTMQNNGDGTTTLIPEEGTVIEPGTPVNAFNMNKIENAIGTLDDKLELTDLLIPWTTAPIWNSWDAGVQYCKTRTSIVTILININSLDGNVDYGASISELPVGIRPTTYIPFRIYEQDTDTILDALLNTNGQINIREGFSKNKSYSAMVSYCVAT